MFRRRAFYGRYPRRVVVVRRPLGFGLFGFIALALVALVVFKLGIVFLVGAALVALLVFLLRSL